jgi:Uncharacterized alpha/beta hydrolase domain (DUF2235)
MTKNIVICCDGMENEFGDHNSNVVNLYHAQHISHRDPGANGRLCVDRIAHRCRHEKKGDDRISPS